MCDFRKSNALQRWILGVIETVHGLVLALEWNKLTNKPGGKTLKGEYRDRIYEAKMLQEAERPGARPPTDAGRQIFRRVHRKMVTSRNQTLRLYEMVSAS